MQQIKQASDFAFPAVLAAALSMAIGLPGSAAGEDVITQLTHGPYSIVDYNWAPNSQAIAFNENTDMGQSQLSYVMLADGLPQALTSDVDDWTAPRWSPDGQYLLTTFFDEGRRLLCRVEVLTGIRSVVGSDGEWLYSPSFGPAGGFEDVLVSYGAAAHERGIARVDMVNLLAEVWTNPGPGYIRPSWPSLAREGPVFESPGMNGYLQLFQVNAPLGPEHPLTGCQCDVCVADVDPITGCTAFTAGATDDDAADSQLYVQESLGPPVQITFEPVHHSNPRWASPLFGPERDTGGYLLYDRLDAEGNYNIFTIHQSGGLETQLTFGPAPKRLAKSSPDGTKLAYLQFDATEREESGVWNLYVIQPGSTDAPWTAGTASTLRLESRSVYSGGQDLEFRFEIPQGVSGIAELAIFDVSGRKVATVYRGPQEGGARTAVWDGRTDGGHPLASGVFFARLQVGDSQVTRKITRLR